jgi:hypothetical protein
VATPPRGAQSGRHLGRRPRRGRSWPAGHASGGLFLPATTAFIPALESPDRRPALSPPAARSASIRQELPRSVLEGRGRLGHMDGGPPEHATGYRNVGRNETLRVRPEQRIAAASSQHCELVHSWGPPGRRIIPAPWHRRPEQAWRAGKAQQLSSRGRVVHGRGERLAGGRRELVGHCRILRRPDRLVVGQPTDQTWPYGSIRSVSIKVERPRLGPSEFFLPPLCLRCRSPPGARMCLIL